MLMLGELLRLYRTVNRLTVRQFAPELRISPATLSRIERGQTCDLETWLRLQQWLLAEQQ